MTDARRPVNTTTQKATKGKSSGPWRYFPLEAS